MHDKDRSDRGRVGSEVQRLGAVTLVLGSLAASGPLLAQGPDSGSVAVLFTVYAEPTVGPAAPQAGSRSAEATLSELRRARPLPDLTLGRMVSADVAAAIDGLPLHTAIDFEVLLDSTPQTRSFGEERGADARNCGVARQLAMLNHLDFVLCGVMQELSESGFHVGLFVVATDTGEEGGPVEATVEDLAGATQHAVSQFQEWVGRRQR